MPRTELMTMGEEEIAFFFHVGNAVTEWANVEMVIRTLVQECFENRGADDVTHRALAVGYNSLATFNAKMDFGEAVVERWLEQHKRELLPRWADLVDRTRRTAKFRHWLAHRRVKEYPAEQPGRRFLLLPSVYPIPTRKSKKESPPPPGSQGLRDIVKMRDEFLALAVTLSNFADAMKGKTASYPEAEEQAGRLATLPKVRNQILEGLARLLKPSSA